MNIQSFVTDFFDSNIYLLKRGSKNIMIDCGGTEKGTLQKLSQLAFVPDFVLLTHGHIDHILALPAVAAKAKIFISSIDKHYLTTPAFNLSEQLIGRKFEFGTNVYDYSQLPNELDINVLDTPGHTPGSVCLLMDKNLFTGDTLFCGGIGNTGFTGGSYEAEIKSVKRLLSLPEDIIVYPGHGPTTTIKNEKMIY